MDYEGWECTFVSGENGVHWHLLEGEPGEWLKDHGHSRLIREVEKRDYDDDFFLEIKNPDIALLFKLTWL